MARDGDVGGKTQPLCPRVKESRKGEENRTVLEEKENRGRGKKRERPEVPQAERRN